MSIDIINDLTTSGGDATTVSNDDQKENSNDVLQEISQSQENNEEFKEANYKIVLDDTSLLPKEPNSNKKLFSVYCSKILQRARSPSLFPFFYLSI